MVATAIFTAPFRLQATHALDSYVLEYLPAASRRRQSLAHLAADPTLQCHAVKIYRDASSLEMRSISVLGPERPCLGSETEPHVYQCARSFRTAFRQ